ncbi:MAG TPA: rRNA maturation RNase YbeY [Pseudomonadales bacterium]|jgi:probable rRNA maturation factor|nr:rRNA maturation RNase YbeY [Pseudomonadales bacterium]HNL92707.1 rRNA maturation RNase YbeY [Pseudomonadales bacterium]HNN87494.1 rRNA maturation RNase YbeY [Pseudomonadales bacterium]
MIDTAATDTHVAIQVFIDNTCDADNIPDAAQFTQWVQAALLGLRTRADVSIGILTEEDSAALNQQYRSKHYATNVLSFPSDLPEDFDPPLLGDLALCAAVIEREAQEQHKTVMAHWAHMVIHGCLHLLGFDHIEDDEAEHMEAREIAILCSLGIDNPYESADNPPKNSPKERAHHP